VRAARRVFSTLCGPRFCGARVRFSRRRSIPPWTASRPFLA